MGAKHKMFGLIWFFSYPIFMNTQNEIYDYLLRRILDMYDEQRDRSK